MNPTVETPPNELPQGPPHDPLLDPEPIPDIGSIDVGPTEQQETGATETKAAKPKRVRKSRAKKTVAAPVDDPLLSTDKPKAKRKAAVKTAKPATPEVKKKKVRAQKQAEKRKPNGGWSKPSNFAEIKTRAKARLRTLKDATETAEIAADMNTDAKFVRWAFRELAKEKLCRLRLNKRKRTEVVPVND